MSLKVALWSFEHKLSVISKFRDKRTEKTGVQVSIIIVICDAKAFDGDFYISRSNFAAD